MLFTLLYDSISSAVILNFMKILKSAESQRVKFFRRNKETKKKEVNTHLDVDDEIRFQFPAFDQL